MKTVQVLMSSYNGEKYIREQIDSILAQQGVNVILLVRDDGSSDSTCDILKEYENKKLLEGIYGENVGPAKSFFDLINKAVDADYYALSDQDDVWDGDKLLIAIEALSSIEDNYALYCSNTRLVDGNLNFIKNEDDNPLISLESSMIKNFCTGCTVVFNKKLIKLLQNNTPRNVVAHDWWINVVTLALDGKVIYDTNPHICYRQHGSNVSGAEKNTILKAKNRLRKFLRGRYHRDLMAKELLSRYESYISNEKKRALYILENGGLPLLFAKSYRTNSYIDTVLFKICVIFNKY